MLEVLRQMAIIQKMNADLLSEALGCDPLLCQRLLLDRECQRVNVASEFGSLREDLVSVMLDIDLLRFTSMASDPQPVPNSRTLSPGRTRAFFRML